MIYLYLIGSDCGPFKIGITGSLERRLEAINGASHLRQRVRAAVALADRVGARRAEQGAHRKLSAFRLNGEWFGCDLETARRVIAEFGEIEPPESLPIIKAGPVSVEDNAAWLLRLMAPMSDANVGELARMTGGPPERLAFARWRAERIAVGDSSPHSQAVDVSCPRL